VNSVLFPSHFCQALFIVCNRLAKPLQQALLSSQAWINCTLEKFNALPMALLQALNSFRLFSK